MDTMMKERISLIWITIDVKEEVMLCGCGGKTYELTGQQTRSVIFFFFQAKDGIRDVAVTGVQTCALPICSKRPTPRQADGTPSSRIPASSRALTRRPPRCCMWWCGSPLEGSHQPEDRQHQHGQIGRASCRERV